MSVPNFIEVYDNGFTDDFCNDLIKTFEHNYNNSAGNHIDENSKLLRDDKVIYLGESNPDQTTRFNELLTNNIIRYSESYPIIKDINIKSFIIKLQRTLVGGGYHLWHCEQGGHEVSSRVIVWSVYLNDIEKGGETEFLYQSERVEPKKGRVVFFPASWTHVHRGNPPLSGTKYMATGWFTLS